MTFTPRVTARDARHIIVAGSGLAGLTAALRADALGHDVTLVTKAALDESNSRYAQGGVAAAVFDDDAPSLHVSDTLVAGAGLSVLEAVEVLCSDGATRIDDLVQWGVRFDRTADGRRWSRGLEAAHSRSRVLHAGGDATGAAIVRALLDRLRESRVRIVERAFLIDLDVTEGDGDGGRTPDERRVTGIRLLLDDGSTTTLHADAVILATGGAGQLYEFTTNPAVATGDGLAAARSAGAAVADTEFFQFHPTALAVPGRFLVSEAVRGEGAVLLDGDGRRFMFDVDPRGELAPRDIVARGIADLMARQDGAPALLDATGLGAPTLAARFPTITAATRAAGLDWATELIPVTPAAHYFMGGVVTDLAGRTTLPGLFAVGEVASTGVHGANRLASNSLLEAAVFGWRAAEAITGGGGGGGAAGSPSSIPENRGEHPALALLTVVGASESGIRDRMVSRTDVQHLMWRAAGLHRSGAGLARAAADLASMRVSATAGAAAVAGTTATTADLETANLLDVARLLVAAALAREESRGAHFRTDFPVPSPAFARSTAWAREVRQHAHR